MWVDSLRFILALLVYDIFLCACQSKKCSQELIKIGIGAEEIAQQPTASHVLSEDWSSIPSTYLAPYYL